MPWCNMSAMQAHLAEISAMVDPGAHAVLILDQAGWHTSAKLIVPGNMTEVSGLIASAMQMVSTGRQAG